MIWLAAEQPCGKRLKAALALWLPHYETERGVLDGALRERVLAPGAATIDRLLAPCRVALGSRGRCGTRPGTLLRKQIPVRTEHWDVAGPGWIEADTVAHCGESMAGDFVWSLTMTDVHTQWTETRAVWNKGRHGVQTRIAEVEKALPFASLGDHDRRRAGALPQPRNAHQKQDHPPRAGSRGFGAAARSAGAENLSLVPPTVRPRKARRKTKRAAAD